MSIRFEFTKDPNLLAQYYQIREACFRQQLGINSFDGSEDLDDRAGHILIARDGNRCVGGARISGTTPLNPVRLPMECDNFVLKEHFPELAQQDISYCQWTRLALLPECRTTEILRAQCLALIEGSAELNYSFAFNVAGAIRARLYRRLHTNLGYDYEICNHISIPAEDGFNNLEHLLSVAAIKPETNTLACFDSPKFIQRAA
uniref:hypothetical protein n=1 Tax=Marinobacterium profundum TaxID=1714300 RepID=UPI000832554D|nr:hypothetical protein [Marinobacterium profundum]